MKTPTIEARIEEDALLLTKYLKEDGEVPPVVFFHFKKTNRKIANMMNEMPHGKMAVKNGFMIALADPLLAQGRYDFMHFAGVIFATMKLLNVIEEPESVVFVTEAFASSSPDMIEPSKDPKSIDVFIGMGCTFDGETGFMIKEKKLVSRSIDGEISITPELVDITEKQSDNIYSTKQDGCVEFFRSYKEALVNIEEQGEYKLFQAQAKEDPLQAFREGMEAATMMGRMGALRRDLPA